MSSQKYDKLSDQQKHDILLKHYVKNKQSFNDIASIYDTYANKIRRDAKKFNIKIRNKSDAQKNALQTGKHKHPTKGTQRDENTKNKIGYSVMKAWDNLSQTELEQRKETSRKNWQSLDDDVKENILKLANEATRLSSKTGSKLEKFLLNELLKDGHVVEFHKEQTLSNTKLQIDLFLPTISLAIEVDGPSHFEPIWGNDALKRNEKYDQKKNGLLIGKGSSLVRIKQKGDFSKARAKLIYSKLKAIIDNKLYKKDTLLQIED